MKSFLRAGNSLKTFSTHFLSKKNPINFHFLFQIFMDVFACYSAKKTLWLDDKNKNFIMKENCNSHALVAQSIVVVIAYNDWKKRYEN